MNNTPQFSADQPFRHSVTKVIGLHANHPYLEIEDCQRCVGEQGPQGRSRPARTVFDLLIEAHWRA